jgi:hypothetical protein
MGTAATVPLICQAYKLPMPEAEVVFLPGRKFRADWLWWGPPRKVILEVDGGLFRGGKGGGSATGGHSSARGILRDQEKGNLAQLAGFLYLRCTPQDVATGKVAALLTQALKVSA